ncbi:MAG TPA: integrase core domain-containing protein [Planctomycetota bacterium]|nr:integrase core domain-containing protein [Planctomycetota bacterium]
MCLAKAHQNCYAERVIGTLQRECTDKVIVLSERQLQRLLEEFVAYYNGSRGHMALEGNSPVPRAREQRPAAEIHGTPVLGGLHQCYRAVA